MSVKAGGIDSGKADVPINEMEYWDVAPVRVDGLALWPDACIQVVGTGWSRCVQVNLCGME